MPFRECKENGMSLISSSRQHGLKQCLFTLFSDTQDEGQNKMLWLLTCSFEYTACLDDTITTIYLCWMLDDNATNDRPLHATSLLPK